MAGHLAGVRVVDLSQIVAGPFCTHQLALLGADVVRVEPPGGDPVRWLGRDEALGRLGLGTGFIGLNGAKRSLALDLKRPEGCEVLARLIAGADVLVQNFRPGVMARLGFDLDELRRTRPALIVCSISGYGTDGPFSDRPAYDQVLQAACGIMSVNGTTESGPLRVGFPLVDCAVGLNAAFAICAALAGRARTGRGDHLDVALFDTGLLMLQPLIAEVLYAGADPVAVGNRPFSGSPFSGSFQTAEGNLSLAGNTAAQCRAICRLTGLDDCAWLTPSKWAEAGPAVCDAVRGRLAAALRALPAAEWEARFAEADVPAARARSLREAMAESRVSGRGFLRPLGAAPGLPAALETTATGFESAEFPPAPLPAPPRLGADARAVLAEIGLEGDEAERLIAEGVVTAPPADG